MAKATEIRVPESFLKMFEVLVQAGVFVRKDSKTSMNDIMWAKIHEGLVDIVAGDRVLEERVINAVETVLSEADELQEEEDNDSIIPPLPPLFP